MDTIIKLIQDMDFGTLIVLVTAFYLYNRIFLVPQFSLLNGKLDKIDEKVTDMDRRLCRLEGAFSSKDCCRIGDEKQFKKVD